MIELREDDLIVVGKIQEAKSTTPKRAKEFYRNHVARLANPDIENRAEIIWENFQRGSNGATADVFEETENPVKKAKKEKKAKAAKAPKVKAAKKERTPRVEVSLPELEKEVELKPVPDMPGIYTANLFGKKHVVVWAERARADVKARFQAIGFSEGKLEAAKKYAKAEELPVGIVATVRVKGRLDQGYAMDLELFNKFKCKEGAALAVNLRGEARAAYAEKGWAGVKFSEAKAEEKAA